MDEVTVVHVHSNFHSSPLAVIIPILHMRKLKEKCFFLFSLGDCDLVGGTDRYQFL